MTSAASGSTANQSATPGVNRPRITVLDVLRFASELIAFALLALWGALAWSFPLNIVMAVAAPLAAILLWALFVSPKAVIRTHPFVRAVVELVIFASVTVAMWHLGQPLFGLVFGVIAVVIGALHNARGIAPGRAR